MNIVTQKKLKERKNPVIELPVNIILNERGVYNCRKKSIPNRDLIDSRGSKKEGFSWHSFKAPMLQKMLINDMIEAVEIKRTEYSTVKMDVMDLTKLLMYGIIYRKFISDFRNEILSSKQYELLKRKYHGLVNSDFNYTREQAEKYISSNSVDISIMKNEILMGPFALINNNSKIDAQSADEYRWILNRLTDSIDMITWFVLHMTLRAGDRIRLLNDLNRVMMANLRKTEIAEYIGLMLLELIQNAERMHYENIAKKRNLIKEGESILTYLKDSRLRALVAGYARHNNMTVKVNYSIRGNTGDDKRLRLNISVVYDGAMSEKMRSMLVGQFNAGTDSSLADFYYSNEGSMTGSGLGMYYLSYIEDACREQGISFDARIINDTVMDVTEYLMMLYI